MTNGDGEEFVGDSVSIDMQAYYACAGIYRTVLVKDEVAEAVVDGTAPIMLHGL